jgi:benzoate/toluate 1,2-dioxygenase reductase component
MNKIALNFEDGVTRIIEAMADETLANAAYRVGINIPVDCNDGVCGTCKCRWKSGDYEMGDYIDDALSDNEVKQGFSLACQMMPTTDMVIDILASSAACKVKIETFVTTITKLEFLSSEIVKMIVKSNDGHKFSYLAGQYANIEMPESVPNSGISRSYSFSGLSDTDSVEFLIRLLPQGAMSDYLRQNAKVGDTLNLTAPFGSFYLRKIEKPTLFFAGGTGIAPFLAMLAKLSIEKIVHPIHLFYGATTDENLVELERLEAFQTLLPLKIFTCVNIEKSEKHAQGFVTQWITKENLGENEYDIYICGPPPMVNAVNVAIEKEQINQRHFYEEKFVPSGS